MPAPCIFPTLRYADADAAIGWLTGAAGFTEHAVYRDDAGVVMHAELSLGSSIIMLGQRRDGEYERMAGEPGGEAGYVAVADIGPLFDRIKSSGAEILRPPYDTDYGSREFTCRDPGGYLWSFGTYWPRVEGATP